MDIDALENVSESIGMVLMVECTRAAVGTGLGGERAEATMATGGEKTRGLPEVTDGEAAEGEDVPVTNIDGEIPLGYPDSGVKVR